MRGHMLSSIRRAAVTPLSNLGAVDRFSSPENHLRDSLIENHPADKNEGDFTEQSIQSYWLFQQKNY